MKNLRCLSIYSFVLAIIGVLFSMKFQEMAYWGSSIAIGMMWFWLGAFFYMLAR